MSDERTYTIHSSTMGRSLNYLNRRMVSNLDLGTLWQRHMRQAYATIVRIVRGAANLKARDERHRIVLRRGPEAEIDVYEGALVSVKPPGLKSDRAPAYRPVRPVLRYWKPATYV